MVTAMRALNAKLFRDLWHVRGQALAIAAVMACGVTIVIMTYGAMVSLRQTRDAYYQRNEFADVFSQLRRAPLRLARQIGAMDGVAAADPRISHYAALDIPGIERPAAAWLVSLPETNAPALNRLVLRSGRLPARGRDELVMSENMARALHYSPGSRFGVLLGGRKRLFTVVGVALSPEFVYVLAPGQLMPDDRTFGILWLDRPVMEAAYDMDGAFNSISLKLAPGARPSEAVRRLDAMLARYGGTAAYGREDQQSHAFVAQELDQLKTIALVIPPVFLGVAAFLIHMVMSRLIQTERESIGLLKSFGYSNGEIGWHYLKFALLIAALGVAVGAAAGLWLGRWMTDLYQDYFRFPFLEYRMDLSVFGAAISISFVAALAGTWRAVREAAALSAAVAMTPPAPAIFRRSLLDRLGWTRHISVPAQMILRHIERWPLRALLTLSGIALAVMLLVSLFFFFDAIDELVDSFYFRSNHQDVVIGLVEQRGERAVFDIGRMPGVRGAGPVVEAPARLSHGHLSQRMGITGLPQDQPFRAFYDSGGRSLTLPEQGILLSSKLASLLDLHVGDRVEVEVLEGARRQALVPVSAIATEYVGLSAYMDRRALAALTGESGGVTAIQAFVDGAAQPQLLRRLKEVPAVANISTRAEAIASMRENMAKSMTIVIDFYIALGAIIAFGVVYNAARIALSERGRELASLRVLGFFRAEVGFILLGELALLAAAALPLGCVLGYGLSWAMSRAMDTKLFRVPFLVEPSTFGIAMSVVLISAGLSALAVARRVNRLDLIAVLKTRE
jgi:putative ABC transport system permease protein